MTSHVQHRRSLTAGAALPNLPMKAGELAVNIPDRALFMGDGAASIPMLGVRAYSTLSNYAANDIVSRNGTLLVAKVPIPPGAFNAANWNNFTTDPPSGGTYLPAVGGTLTGDLTIEHPTSTSLARLKPATAGQASNLILDTANATAAIRALDYRTNALLRWRLSATSAAEAGSGVGSDFVLARYNDLGAFVDNPITVNRASGVVNISSLTLTNALTFPDGTQALPGIAFTSDLDLGAYRVGANIAALVAGNQESARWHSNGLSVRSPLTASGVPLIVDRLNSGSTLPVGGLTAGTVAALLGNSAAASGGYLTLIGGNASVVGINFGDTDADARGYVRYTHVDELLSFFAVNSRFRFNGTTGQAAVAQAMPGIELLAGTMNTTSKYTMALKFGSTDPELTTTTPKFGAVIAGAATETYSADTTGGMAIDFFTQPNAPGVSGNLLRRLRIQDTGQVIVGDSDTEYGIDGLTMPQLETIASAGGMAVIGWGSAVSGGRFQFMKSKGAALGTRGIVAINDTLAEIDAAGDDGTIFKNSSRILFQVDTAPAAGIVPGRIIFQTADSAGALGTVMTLASTNQVSLSAPASASVANLLIVMAALGIGTVWNDGTRIGSMRAVAAGWQFGADSNHSLAFYTNNAIRATISAAGTFTYKTAAQGTNTTELASTAFVHDHVVGGVGRAWSDVTSTRLVATDYTAPAYPIMVCAQFTLAASSGATFLVGGAAIASISAGSSSLQQTLSVCVQAGATYRINIVGGASKDAWKELR